METHEAVIRALRVFNLQNDAAVTEVRKAYLDFTSQKKFQEIFLGIEDLENEFIRYYESYMLFLKYQPSAQEEAGQLPKETVFSLILNQGIYFLIHQKYLKAGEKLQEAYKLNQQHVLLLVYMGILLLKRKNHYAAEKYLLQATAIDRNCDGAWYYLGETYQRTGKLDKALKMFETAKVLNPLRQEVAYRIKEIRESQGRPVPRSSGKEKKSIFGRVIKRKD
jgi:tetratricopeptide (TPR) repeat protein